MDDDRGFEALEKRMIDREPPPPERLAVDLEKRLAEAQDQRRKAERDLRMWRAVEAACRQGLGTLQEHAHMPHDVEDEVYAVDEGPRPTSSRNW